MLNNKTQKIVSPLLPVLLLIVGLYMVPISIFETDFSKIPGDFGDSRFNNYILEHGYKYFTGQVHQYWNAPFMYPYNNVIAFSDNLLGTVPIYSLFRISGLDRETAYQFWILAMFALNFICCYWALKKWSHNNTLSATGAYIYAFGVFILGQLDHLQVFPRFIVPLVFYWCWQYLSTKQTKYLFFTLLGIVYQFYCGIYLGFFLLYTLLFLFITYLIVYRDWILFTQFRKIKTVGYFMGALATTAALLAPLMIPYIKISEVTGMRKFDELVNSIPKPGSYFFTHVAASSWQILSKHGKQSLPDWWLHFLFVGGLPWLAVLLMPIILLSKKIRPERRKFILLLLSGLFLSIIFCMDFKSFTLYRAIFNIPGFSSMRSIDRIINIQAFYFVLIFVFVFKELLDQKRKIKWLLLCIPMLVIIDNRIDANELKRYEKLESQQKINDIKQKIINQYDKKYTAIAYTPLSELGSGWRDHVKKIETHLSVMFAAQELNIPCVNAYTGDYPGGYMDFFDQMNEASLRHWCEFNAADKEKIQRINNAGKPEKEREVINIKAYNGKFVCADEDQNNILFATKDKADSWETFSVVIFNDNQCILRAHNNLFVTVDTGQNSFLNARSYTLGEHQVFDLIELDSNEVTFKAGNGKYLTIDEKSSRLVAISTQIGEKEKFKIQRNDIIINLRAFNKKFVCADESASDNSVFANRDIASNWERFVLIEFDKDYITLRTSRNFYFSAEVDKNGLITASRKNVGEWEKFKLVKADIGYALKACNGKYVSVDLKSMQLFAQSDTVGIKEKFELIK